MFPLYPAAEAATVNRFAKYKAVAEKEGLLLNIGRFEILIEDKDSSNSPPRRSRLRWTKLNRS